MQIPFKCLSSRVHFCSFVSNVLAPVLISVDLCCVLQAGEGCHMCRPAAPELISVAIPLYLSVSVISASEMSKIAKTFNDYWTKVLQNLGFRRVRVRIYCKT